MFERTLIGTIKANSDDDAQILDLGIRPVQVGWPLKPPTEPLAFCAGHRYGKQAYTDGSDRDRIVAPKFKEATEDILGGLTKLNYEYQRWNDVHAARLGLVLPLCVSLRTLTVSKVGLTATGLRAILEPIVDDNALFKLEELDISYNQELGEEGARALGAALKKQGAFENLRTLDVKWCNLTATGGRAILEPIVTDRGLRALPILEELTSCDLTATGLRATLEPMIIDHALPVLEKLVMWGNEQVDDEARAALKRARPNVALGMQFSQTEEIVRDRMP